jgi:hypothetical protein
VSSIVLPSGSVPSTGTVRRPPPSAPGGRLTHDGQQRVTEDRDRRIALSGQSALGPVLDNAADYSVGALVLLISCKGLAYCLALSSLRGGPIFPAMFLGAVGVSLPPPRA